MYRIETFGTSQPTAYFLLPLNRLSYLNFANLYILWLISTSLWKITWLVHSTTVYHFKIRVWVCISRCTPCEKVMYLLFNSATVGTSPLHGYLHILLGILPFTKVQNEIMVQSVKGSVLIWYIVTWIEYFYMYSHMSQYVMASQD